MTLDVLTEVSLEPTSIKASPSEKLTFRVTVNNRTRGPRTYRALAVGLKNAIATYRCVSPGRRPDGSADPQLLLVPAHDTGHIEVTIAAVRTDATFPTGRFLIGIEVHDTTPSDPSVTLLNAEVEVSSIEAISIELREPNLSGWRGARTTVHLRNEGGAPVELSLWGFDPEGRFEYRFSRKGKALGSGDDGNEEKNLVTVPGKSSRALTIRLKSPPQYVGINATRSFEVLARNPGGSVATTGTFKQRPLFHPVLFKIVAGVLLVFAGMLVARAAVQKFIADPPVFTWEELAESDVGGQAPLEPRVGHTAVWLQFERHVEDAFLTRQWRTFLNWFLGRDQEVEGLIVWGGRDGAGDALGDGAFYRVRDQTWVGLTDDNNVAGVPVARVDHTVIWTGETMAIWGGLVPESDSLDDRGSEYDPSSRTWTPLPVDGPSPRVGHTLTWTGEVAVMVGGYDALGGPQGDTWLLTPGQLDPNVHPGADPDQRELALSGGSWAQLPSLPSSFGPRYHHSATWTGRYLIVFGGFDSRGQPLADAYAIEIAGENPTWIDITRNPAPTARACHRALWTGSDVLFLGGTAARVDVTNQAEAAPVCRGTASTELGQGSDAAQPPALEALIDDPEAWLLSITDPEKLTDQPKIDWSLPDAAPPNYLGSDFEALWTSNEATVLQAVPQLETLAAVRYSPKEGTTTLPVPGSDIFGAARGFTSIWINGGVVVWGGIVPVDRVEPGADTVEFSNDGALLVLPDR